MDNNNIESLILRYYNDELDAADSLKVETWIQASDENRKIAEQIYYLCFATDALEARSLVNSDKALLLVNRRIAARRWKRTFKGIQRVAAVLALPLIVLSGWLLAQVLGYYSQTVKVTSAPGMVSCVVLPDSSTVWLNSSSSLTYPTRFGKERRVCLQGEGYFSVSKDDRHKFVVDAYNSEVEVFGTEFNIEAYRDDFIRTTLAEGSVGVYYDDQVRQRRAIRLQPGQVCTYNSRTGEMQLVRVNVDCVTSWKDGRIVLDRTPLDEALRIIGNRYNAEFVILDDSLRDSRFTGTFSSQSIDVIQKYFNMSSKISFRQLEEPSADGRIVYEVY